MIEYYFLQNNDKKSTANERNRNTKKVYEIITYVNQWFTSYPTPNVFT